MLSSLNFGWNCVRLSVLKGSNSRKLRMHFRTKLKMCKCSIACYWYINKAGTPVNLYHCNVISTGCSVSMSNETHKHIFLS
jgi:hypothetical protein